VPEMIGDKAYMDPLTCQSCGICAAECPARAITVKTTKEHMLELRTGLDAIEAEDTGAPAIVGFVCQFGHVWGADHTFEVAKKLPDNVRLVQVLCPARLEPIDFLRAFEDGVERVFVTICGPNYCHYKTGNGLTERRLDYVRAILDGAGIGGDKLVSFAIDSNTSLATIVEEMSK